MSARGPKLTFWPGRSMSAVGGGPGAGQCRMSANDPKRSAHAADERSSSDIKSVGRRCWDDLRTLRHCYPSSTICRDSL